MSTASSPSHPKYNPTGNWTITTHPPAPYTIDDVINHLTRMETRLVKLMHHVGLDANGRVREEN